MILSKKPLSLAEAKEYIKDLDENKPVVEYIKKFNKLTKAQATKLAEAIRALNNPKIREEQLVKILDFLPEDSEDVNKIFSDSGLNEEEVQAIVKLVKEI